MAALKSKVVHKKATHLGLPLAKPLLNQIAGSLPLDFCNTAGEHLAVKPDELLLSWEIFLGWALHVGLIGKDGERELLQQISPIGEILQLRDAIHHVGVAIARGVRIPARDLDLIRDQASTPKPRIVASGRGLCWKPSALHGSDELRSVLASEALALFCSPRSARIGVCDGGLCGWLFLDDSRGKRRRWCDMNDCGNRAKARRYYEQHKSA